MERQLANYEQKDEKNITPEGNAVMGCGAVDDVSQQQGVQHACCADNDLNSRQRCNPSFFSARRLPEPAVCFISHAAIL